MRAVEAAFGLIDVGGGDRRAQVLEAQAVGGKRRGVGLDAHGRLLPAADADQPDARRAAKSSAPTACRRGPGPWASGKVAEVKASVRIGASAGLTLL